MEVAIVVVGVVVIVGLLVAMGWFAGFGRMLAARWPSQFGWLADNARWQGGAPRVNVPVTAALAVFAVLGLVSLVLRVL